MTAPDDRLPPEPQPQPQPQPLRDFWDAFLAGRTGDRSGDLDPGWAETIARLHAADDAPAPDAAMVERIWQDAVRRQASARQATANGWHATGNLLQTTTLAATRVAPTTPRWLAVPRRLAGGFVREVGVGVLAGFLAGLIVIGGGARLIMRVLAMTADPALQGTLTNNGERVGEITLDGTLFLLLSGAFAGALGGGLFALIKPWLPWSGWRRGLVFGLLLAATFGSLALENGDNPDYRRFGLPFLNVCIFNLLPVGFGLLVVPIAERLDRRLPTAPLAGSTWRRARGIATYAVLTVASLPALMLVVPVFFGANPVGLAVVGLVLSRAAIARWAGRFERPSDLLARPAAFAAAYVVLLLPALAGLALTLQAAGQILGIG